ncbi:MAG: hypothetical protein Fur0043_21020 [Anaerolineales bacterium]
MKSRRFILWTLACLALLGWIAAWGFSRLPVTIHARIAERGGFTPDHLRARVGEPLHLRLIAEDVEHTFAVGQNVLPPLLLKPGEAVEITLTFDKPGTYTFYTTTPSSLNFWRMRGTIEVTGEEEPPPSEPPLYVRLGLDLDEEHGGDEEPPEWARPPSASRGEAFGGQIPAGYLSRDYYLVHSPFEAFADLRSEPPLQSLNDEEIWDVVAFLWRQNTSSAALTEGRTLYQANCAACHGENGAGDGQFADEMKAIAEQMRDPHGIQPPTDFREAEHLLEASPALLQGKILRGGMGTGMPMWGSIFTEEQTWNLVAYLYSFQFEYSP